MVAAVVVVDSFELTVVVEGVFQVVVVVVTSFSESSDHLIHMQQVQIIIN